MFTRFFTRSAPQNVDKVPPAPIQTAPSSPAAAVREENLKTYRKGGFHPVRLGDTFDEGRYAVIRKLGFGVYSTVWLCTDNQ
jgi:serine/threonine-protein kinase SRPK3